MLLNNQWIIEEIKKYLEKYENKNTMILRKEEKSQINNLTLHVKQLEEEEQTKHKVSIRKEIIKIRAEINEIEMKKTIEKINKDKS